ncbi:hypothetical protein GT347_07145 [Xylophilus rhododendri]|uniref:Transmembrane protein n=1 Tax=Xylophilus rhododendri TaxID=2697032 RepID=A0A857J237_9BURK|nr:hypothetical protein [Xylophilus rhododendri]QHI97786.1 hypothetical protein GT347_07145 [Xylophilus rhododendri]
MTNDTIAATARTPGYEAPGVISTTGGASASAVSWGAILAGAAAAAALSLILLVLGAGLGAASASPWASRGADAGTIGIGGILWITITGLLASGLGGYLAGRLRTKWVSVHTDEVYFRDTAHGFLAWAVATLVTAAVLTSAVGSVVGAGAQAGAAVAGGAATAATAATAGAATAGANGNPSQASLGTGYYVDALFRKAAAAPAPAVEGQPVTAAAPAPVPATNDAQSSAATAAEVTRIFANSIRTGDLPADDVRYVGQLVSQRTGLSQQDAEKRVTDIYAQAKKKIADTATAAKEAADKARKASAYTALWLFISLLISAFAASYAATFGGRQRDL